MAKRSGPPPIIYIVAVALLAAGGWFAYRRLGSSSGSPPPSSDSAPATQPTPAQAPQSTQAAAPPAAANLPALDTSEPNPSVIQMDGSVSMVALMQNLRNLYSQQYPNIPTTYGYPEDGRPGGSSDGLQHLINNEIQLAANSRPLRPAEAQAGLQSIPIAKDAVAIVVGVENPFQGELSLQQVADIYQGQITNWNQVGGPDAPIRVLNRSPQGGTHDLFKDVVLLGQDFAPDGPNFITFEQDVTTPILRELGTNGISYAPVAHVENQSTVRILPIDGINPAQDQAAIKNGTYAISRNVFLTVPRITSPAVKNFIDLALSPQGQQIAARSDFIPLQ